MGNVCRSPAIQAYVLRELQKKGLAGDFYIDSAGVSVYVNGSSPDMRMMTAALLRGLEIEHSARQVAPEDYTVFDLIVPLTQDIKETLLISAPKDAHAEIYLPEGMDVSDPYFDQKFKFDKTLDEIEELGDLVITRLLEK